MREKGPGPLRSGALPAGPSPGANAVLSLTPSPPSTPMGTTGIWAANELPFFSLQSSLQPGTSLQRANSWIICRPQVGVLRVHRWHVPRDGSARLRVCGGVCVRVEVRYGAEERAGAQA